MKNGYPIDTDTLKKGQYLSPEKLETITMYKAGTDKFALAVLAIRQFIERETEKNGRHLLCKQEGKGLRILTDSEAAKYKPKRFDNSLKGMFRQVKDMLRIDTMQLTDDEKKKLERSTYIRSRLCTAVTNERKTLLIASKERTVPKLGVPSE